MTETLQGVVRRARRGRVKPDIYGRCRVIRDADANGALVRCIVPLGAADLENIRERNFKNGDLVRMKVSKATDPHANRTLHALGKMVVANIEGFQNLNSHQALKRLQAESGVHCEQISISVEGSDELLTANIPISLSFDSTDDGEYRAAAHGLAKFLVERYWKTVSADWVLDEMGKMVAKVESL